MKKKIQRCFAIVIASAIALEAAPIFEVKADAQEEQVSVTIDAETAETLAMLFVEKSASLGMAWSSDTDVFYTELLYNVNNTLAHIV